MAELVEEKLRSVLEYQKLSEEQRNLMNQWYNHLIKSQPIEQILKRAYIIKEFGLFLNKPFEKATRKELEFYFESKKGEVAPISLEVYRFKIQGFYKWIIKNTPIKIDLELAYPTPKIITKVEKTKEERCEFDAPQP